MDKDTLKIVIDTFFDLAEETFAKNIMVLAIIKVLRTLITAVFLSKLLRRLKEKGVTLLLLAFLLPTAVQAADGDAGARARAALAVSLALHQPPAPAAAKPVKPAAPTPAPIKAAPCSAYCTCGCNAGKVCECKTYTLSPATVPVLLPSAGYAAPCGPRG